MIRTGRRSAFLKSNLTHPLPRLHGSRVGRPCFPGTGYPIETTSYSQPDVAARTSLTMRPGVIRGPEGILIGVRLPDARTLMFVPPTSMTRIFTDRPAIAR